MDPALLLAAAGDADAAQRLRGTPATGWTAVDPPARCRRVGDRRRAAPSISRWPTPCRPGLEALEGIDEGVDPVRAPALHQALASRVVASPPFSLTRTASARPAPACSTPVMEQAWTPPRAIGPSAPAAWSATLDLGWMLHVQAQAGIDGTEMLLLDPRQEAPVLVRLDDSRLVRAYSGEEA